MLRLGGVDSHVLLTLLLRGWSVLAGGATVLLVPICMPPAQQGYYFTFIAVLATQIFFELGLNHVLTQLTSHSAAYLKRASNGYFEGDLYSQRAIVSLLVLARKWNSLMASLFFLVLLTGGSYFFFKKGTLQPSEWVVVWLVLIVATACNLAMSAQLAICEGLGEVGQVARLRLKQSIVGYLLLWGLLLSGQGLWAAAALPLASVFGTAWWLLRQPQLRRLRENVQPDLDAADLGHYSWRRDIFPLQWRIALSWASGYFIFNFLTPVVFAQQGAIEAGRLGLALTIFGAISTVGYSWVSAKIPALSMHVARKERHALDTLFNRQTLGAIVVTTFCALMFLAVIPVAGLFIPTAVERLPTFQVLLMLSAVTVANTITFAMAAYMRAHKEEPLLIVSLVSGALIGGGVYFMAQYSLLATVAAYSGVVVLVSLPWCSIIFLRYRKRYES